jgi:hypothetical protein
LVLGINGECNGDCATSAERRLRVYVKQCGFIFRPAVQLHASVDGVARRRAINSPAEERNGVANPGLSPNQKSYWLAPSKKRSLLWKKKAREIDLPGIHFRLGEICMAVNTVTSSV